MNPAQLLTHLDRLSETPGAITRLRRFILDLAVRGKLAEQDPKDEPASELLKRVQSEMARFVKDGKIRKQKPAAIVGIDERPFELPANWIWTRFGWLADFAAGRTPSRNDATFWNTGDYPWVSIADMQNDGIVRTTKETISEKAKRDLFRSEPCPVGMLIMSFKLTIGKISRLGVPAFHNEAIISIRPHVSELDGYLFLALPQFARQGDTKGAIKGATLNRDSIATILLPLPPLAEQRRIVARVDELMSLCDQLEAAQAERERRRDRLIAVSLQRLNQVSNADAVAFREHVRFHLDHFSPLITEERHLKQLRQTIFNFAIRGKLVAQDPTDEPASKQLKRIQTEKSRLIDGGNLRRERPMATIEELPFDIPEGWAWARIGECSLSTDYGTSVKSDHAEEGVPVLKMGDIQDGHVVFGGQKKVPRSIESLPHLFLKRFDLLYNRTNSAELVGKTGIYLGDDDAYTFASYLIRIRFINDLTSPLYANLAMNAPYFRETQIVPELKQQCGQANVNGTKLRKMIIPFPPLAEQHRIVAKVDALVALCDRLEGQLTRAQVVGRQLFDAVLHEALALVASGPGIEV